MDLPLTSDTDPGPDPLEMVEAILTDEGLDYERTSDGEVIFSLAGEWKAYDLWFSWRPEGECIQLCCTLDLPFEPEHLPALYELLALVNQRVWLGHFELYRDEIGDRLSERGSHHVSDIIFRHTLSVGDSESPSLAQTAHIISSAVETVDRFYPAFDFLLKGAHSPSAAMASCLFETVGEA